MSAGLGDQPQQTHRRKHIMSAQNIRKRTKNCSKLLENQDSADYFTDCSWFYEKTWIKFLTMRDNTTTLTSLRILDSADLVRPVAHMTDTDRHNIIRWTFLSRCISLRYCGVFCDRGAVYKTCPNYLLISFRLRCGFFFRKKTLEMFCMCWLH